MNHETSLAQGPVECRVRLCRDCKHHMPEREVDDKRPITCQRSQVYDKVLNMSEISSGLVAVAWVPDDAIAKLRSGEPKIVLTGVPMLKYEGVNTSGTVVLSDAEAIIAQKDAEILEQCRLNGMGAEREAALLGKVAQQSAALKLAREALDQIDWDIRNGGYADGFPETWARMDKALAAIDALKGE